MEFKVNVDDFRAAVNQVYKAASQKTTLPILSNIKMEVLDFNELYGSGVLELAATNLEMAIVTQVRIHDVKSEGGITVLGRMLNDYLNNIEAVEPVTVTMNDETISLDLKCSGSKSHLVGITAQDFPALPTNQNVAYTAKIGSDVFREVIRQVNVAASNDETRPVLTGIFFEFKDEKMTAAAADSFRLAVKTVEMVEFDTDFNFLAPAKALVEFARLMPNDDTAITINVTGNKSQVFFEFGDTRLSVSLLEGNFPNYTAIVPKSYSSRVRIDSKLLSSKVKLAALFAKDGGNIVKINVDEAEDITPAFLSIASTAQEIGTNEDRIDINLDGVSGKIALNAQYLKSAIECAGTTPQLYIEMQSPSNPCLVKPVGRDDYVHVLMPMSLSR